MKVYIPNYKNPIRTYKWFDKFEDKLSEKTIDRLCDITQFLVDWCWNYPTRKYKERKMYVKIDKWDTWNMDETLAFIITPMLKQLKNTKHGAPYVDDEDVPEELKSSSAEPLTQEQKDIGDIDNNHFKRWDWVLDEMIWAFEQTTLDWEQQYYSGKSLPLKFNKIDNSDYYELEENPKDTFKVDMEGIKKHEERMINGYKLFGKYYRNLWD